ncbi:MAG: PEP/pyruvate-binding domain-containing protein [Verrucomicrobiota bacterium]
MSLRIPAGSSHPRITVDAAENQVSVIERGADFRNWNEWLVGHGTVFDVPDLAAPTAPYRFYRSRFRELTSDDDWKNVLRAKADPFQSPEPPVGKSEPRWVKFMLRLNQPQRVIFQDSRKYLFHYDFAVERLPEFKGFSRQQFDAATLRTNSQKAVLGAVLFSPTENLLEAGIQFVGYDAYPRESVAEWFEVVRSVLGAGPDMQVYYLPTFEQREVALQNANWFASRGIPVSSADRWVIADQIYAPGWALGKLVFVPGAEIALAYREGRLRPDDILLTDAVPAEVPPLAGIIALSPATPNSHVAILAKSFGIPFVHIVQPGFAETVMSWIGREVVLRAIDFFALQEAATVPLASDLPPALRAEILSLKQPPPLKIPPKQSLGQLSIGTESLAPSDIRFVGGKAANFGILRRSIPANAPSPAIAFSFDLWDGYMDQVLGDGRTLRATIDSRLRDFSWPPNMAELQNALDDVRELIRDGDFSPAHRAAIIAALQSAGFDGQRNIRFRSSTNVEDSDQFSGAGLYDSYSGCLADDLDDDTAGPSRCDPEEPRERGVFRALRRVFASFYNDNAFLERLRHRVDETQVGMGVLVHHSTPDVFELANGVALLEFRNYGSGSWMMTTRLITQVGATSVTNPDSAARPEEVSVIDFASGTRPFFSVVTRSSLVQLGATVMNWEQEYRDLYALLKTATLRWQQELGTNELITLDFEYKKVEPGHLRVKQIRTVPPATAPRTTQYLMSSTNRYLLFQGEFGDVIANHRLKSLWRLTTRHTALVSSNRSESLFGEIELDARHGTNRLQFSGNPAALPEYTFMRKENHTAERWAAGSGASHRLFELRVFDIPDYTPWLGPLVFLSDHRLEFQIDYAVPQPTVAFDDFVVTNTLSDVVWLAPAPSITLESKLQQRTLSQRGIEITTRYYWPREPGGTGAGYTAPVIAWVGTTIHGLASRAIELKDEFSQTYRPGHHNSSEDFVFDPWLEPGLDPEILSELKEMNIRAVVVRRGQPAVPIGSLISGGPAATTARPAFEHGDDQVFLFWGLDDQLRVLK